MNVNELPIGYRRNREKEEPCDNKNCIYKQNSFHHSLYLNRKKGEVVWICFHCAKRVDKII